MPVSGNPPPRAGVLGFPAPYWAARDAALYLGDVRACLRVLPTRSVHTCVTSPPYWGLRDYGTAEWIGGAEDCDHDQRRRERDPDSKSATNNGSSRDGLAGRDHCRKCGAKRTDMQIGAEPSPDCGTHGQAQCGACFVCSLVGVFREIKRVLRDDGTVWLNLGDSFSSQESSQNFVKLREDISTKEVKHVILEMFGLRFDGDVAQSQGDVSEVLSDMVKGEPLCAESDMEGRRIQEKLRKEQASNTSVHDGKETSPEVDSNRKTGGEVRLLRGHHVGVSDSGPQEQRWGTAQEEGQRRKKEQYSNIQGDQGSGVSTGQIQSAVLQLQLFNRLLGVLSTQAYKRDEIPNSVRHYFTEDRVGKGNLVGVPWRVALALQADGWVLRSDVPWVKRSAMPESCTSRPCKSLEYVFLLAKGESYYFDMDAVRPASTTPTGSGGACFGRVLNGEAATESGAHNRRYDRPDYSDRAFRNSDLWFQSVKPPYGAVSVADELVGLDVTAKGYKGDHFAVFPPALITPLILASTSEHGCCAACGRPYERVSVDHEVSRRRAEGGAYAQTPELTGTDHQNVGANSLRAGVRTVSRETVGWRKACGCHTDEVVPAVVLDPFVGSGTTVATALELGRAGVGIDLSEAYLRENAVPRVEASMRGERVPRRATVAVVPDVPPAPKKLR